jgi:hypothetical protein
LNTGVFAGTNGDEDWVQFVDQDFGPTNSNRTCIWNIDITVANATNNTMGYTPYSCFSFSGFPADPLAMYGGVEPGDAGLFLVMAYRLFNTTTDQLEPTAYLAEVAPDIYGLGAPDVFDAASGSIYGAGGGSRALFPIPTTVTTEVSVSGCLSDLFVSGVSGSCAGDILLPPNPGASVWPSYVTGETNNLTYTAPAGVTYTNGGYIANVIYNGVS